MFSTAAAQLSVSCAAGCKRVCGAQAVLLKGSTWGTDAKEGPDMDQRRFHMTASTTTALGRLQANKSWSFASLTRRGSSGGGGGGGVWGVAG